MLKSLFAALAIFLASIFGGHHVVTAPSQPAAAVQAQGPQTFPTVAAAISSPTFTAPPPAPAGVVLGASTVSSNYITQDQLTAAIQQATNALRSLIYQNESVPNSLPSTGGYTNTIALTNRIDRLSGTAISNPTISGGSISNASVSGMTGLTTSDIGGFAYATSSDFVHIAAWGDSITSRYGGKNTSWPTQLSLLTGYSVYNGGKGGDTSTQIETRFLAQPDKFSYSTVIWLGRNNYTDPTTVEADIASMVSSLTTSSYVVLSILNGSGEGIGTSAYDQIIALNNTLASTYGSHYLDIRAYLVSQYDSTQSQDVTDNGNDVPPSSLRYDFLHPNTAGYLKIAQYIQSHMSLLASVSGSPLLTTNNLAQFAISPPTFGFVNSQTGYAQDGTTVLVASSTAFTTYVGLGVGSLDTAKWNTALGYQAFYSGTTASSNDAFGYQSLYNTTSGANNSAFGVWSLFNNTTGSGNLAHGGSALYKNTTGANNVGVGFGTLNTNTTGAGNTALGYDASYYNNSATSTVAIGYQAALGNFSNFSNQGSVSVGWSADKKFATGSDYNTLLGYSAGGNITTGAGNIWIGSASTTANSNITTGYANIAIGNNIKLPLVAGSYQLDIGNLLYGTNLDGTGTTLSTGNIGVGTTTPWRKFSVTGTVGFDGLTGAFGAGSLCLSANKEVVYNAGSDSCLSSLRSTKHDINNLALSGTSTIAALVPVSFVYNNDASSTVRYGFIAEDTAAVDSHLATYDQQGKLSGVDDRALLSIVVKAVQELMATVAGFADNFVSAHITVVTGDFNQVNTQKLCVSDSTGKTCITKSQLDQLLAGSGQSSAGGGSSTSSASSGTPDATPPTITINGNNPTTINVGDTYADLGATVTDNVDQNLGLKYFLNGALVSNIVIDTSTAATDTVDYVAADTAGNTATSTRTVIISPTVQADTASTTTQ